MFPSITGRAPRLSAGARLRRITAILAVVAGGMLAWAAAVPAAAAAVIPVPGAGAGYGPAPAALPSPVPVITPGGMPGWQITLIALAAALPAATAAVFLDRARASRPNRLHRMTPAGPGRARTATTVQARPGKRGTRTPSPTRLPSRHQKPRSAPLASQTPKDEQPRRTAVIACQAMLRMNYRA